MYTMYYYFSHYGHLHDFKVDINYIQKIKLSLRYYRYILVNKFLIHNSLYSKVVRIHPSFHIPYQD